MRFQTPACGRHPEMHQFLPSSGPTTTVCQSVTVFAPSCCNSNAWCTAQSSALRMRRCTGDMMGKAHCGEQTASLESESIRVTAHPACLHNSEPSVFKVPETVFATTEKGYPDLMCAIRRWSRSASFHSIDACSLLLRDVAKPSEFASEPHGDVDTSISGAAEASASVPPHMQTKVFRQARFVHDFLCAPPA